MLKEVNEIQLVNDDQMTNSLLVADIFGKRHDAVLRDIVEIKLKVSQCLATTDLGVPNFEIPNFIESEYFDVQNKKRKMYEMNKDSFILLAMGYSGEKALMFKINYIQAFNSMETFIKQHDKKELQQAKDKILQLETKQKKDYSTMCISKCIEGLPISAEEANNILEKAGEIEFLYIETRRAALTSQGMENGGKQSTSKSPTFDKEHIIEVLRDYTVNQK
tara:strand:- start:1390 stop:2049 length:660 start_codon:yes stop_codon:yes gene_type:complete